MKSLLITLLLLYLAFCLALFFGQRKFLYFQQPAMTVSGVVEINFETEGERLSGWVINEGRSKALLYYGGNAEHVENNISFFETVLPDYSVYLIPYRGYGNSSGTPTEKNLYNDALYIYGQIKDKHNNISLMGRSLGSGVATYVAAIRPVDKLILVTPFDSIENVARDIYWMIPVSLLIKDKFQSLHRVKNISAKTTIFIAANDQVITRERTEQLIAQFTDQLEQIIVIDDAGHNDISQFQEYITKIKLALD